MVQIYQNSDLESRPEHARLRARPNKDLAVKANGVIPEANVGYRKNYKSEKLELASSNK